MYELNNIKELVNWEHSDTLYIKRYIFNKKQTFRQNRITSVHSRKYQLQKDLRGKDRKIKVRET